MQAILERDLAAADAERAAMLARQVKIALLGEDGAATRAFEPIARVCRGVVRGDSAPSGPA